MPLRPSTPPLTRHAKTALGLELFLSVGALAGGLALMAGPKGEIIALPLSKLSGSPFDTYLVPGLVLFALLGLGPLVAARLISLRHPAAPLATIVVGLGLLVWMTVEIAIVGYSNEPPLQPFYVLLGLVITVVGMSWALRDRTEGLRTRIPTHLLHR